MCGIAGIWNLGGDPVSRPALTAFVRSLAHRGPDGEGYYLDPTVTLGLGHRRLAILDLSAAGRQPLAYGDGRYWVTFNGEIFNFLELRRELEGLGYAFRSQSDTEVILAAYDRWGAGCQLRFNGMWAFAVWDRRERTLFLSRDRFGIKPLHYVLEPGRRFAFASELKAFLHLTGFEAREDSASLHRMLLNVNALEGGEDTLLVGVRRLPGGHCMTVRADGVRVQRWWSTLEHVVTAPRRFEEQAERFRELFFDACRLRLRSDVPVGTCVSGGVDSSAVLCALSVISASGATSSAADRRTDDWQRAFVATFPGTPLDERHFAELAIRHAGAIPRYKPMQPDAAVEELPRLIYEYEDICRTLPTPVWAIYRELRRDGVVVALDGTGSDEMLGGYHYYTRVALEATGGLLRRPRRTIELINSYCNMYVASGPFPPPSRVSLLWGAAFHFPRRVVRGLTRRTARYLGVPPTPDSSLAMRWLGAAVGEADDADPQEAAAIDALGPLNARLYRDFHQTALPTILRNFDRCSMAHGIEVRMPFMDWRLVSFVFSLPEASKIGGGFTKRVLREAMRGVMPEALRTRRDKIGFSSPLPNWFNGSLRDWLWEQVNSPEFVDADLWDGRAIRAFVEARHRTRDWQWEESERVWPFVHAHAWRRYFLGAPVMSPAEFPPAALVAPALNGR